MVKRKKTSGDVIKMNITAPAPSADWPMIQIFRYPYGLAAKKSKLVAKIFPDEKESKTKVALNIGKAIVDGSKVLSKWFK